MIFISDKAEKFFFGGGGGGHSELLSTGRKLVILQFIVANM